MEGGGGRLQNGRGRGKSILTSTKTGCGKGFSYAEGFGQKVLG